MLAEIDQFVNWVRRRNPEARTWKDYAYDLRQFAALVGDVPPATITFREVDRRQPAKDARFCRHHHQPPPGEPHLVLHLSLG